jgi:8-amino-7-oxononanoate synthase
MRNAKLFSSLLGLQEPQSAIVPLIVGAADLALAASELLEREGYVVTAIRPPTVPNGTARLRFTFTAQHARHDIERLAGTVKRLVLPMMAPEK